MKTITRALIAYVAGRLIMEQDGIEVLDHARGLRLILQGRVDPRRVYIYDGHHERVITGVPSECGLSLTNHRDSTLIDLRVDGSRFEGYDYGSGLCFEGTASAVCHAVSLHVDGDKHYFTYTIKPA